MSGQQYVMPGVARGDGYVPQPVAGAEDNLLGALYDANAALNEAREGEAALPADPALINMRVAISAELDAYADGDARRAKAHYDDPHRSRYSKEGLIAVDQDFEQARAAERAALKARLDERLDNVEDAVRERLDQANALPVGADDDDGAIRFAAQLSLTSPSDGAGLLADFVRDVTPAVAYSALPLLRSMCNKRGEWRGSYELAQAVETLTRLVEERPGAARAAADLKLLDETKRQLEHLVSASADVVAPRFVAGSYGDEVPVAGRAGFALEFSGSETAREMFGDGPSLRDEAPSGPPPRSDWDLTPEATSGFRRFKPGAAAADEE